MGFDLTGHVLRAPHVAPSNASSTAEPSNGVVRDVRPVPAAYDLDVENPSFVDVYADMYRAAVLQAPGTTPTEYLIWSQNSSNLAMMASWWTDLGTGSIPLGSLTVGQFTDGTDRVVVRDDGGRSLDTITHLVVARGDQSYDDEGWADEDDPSQGREGSAPYIVLMIAPGDQNGLSGVVTLTAGQKTTLGGGLSQARGDQVVEVRYTLAPAKFWWTRNDRYQTRFGWSNQAQRWTPYRGGAVKNLGVLAFSKVYTLTPRPRGFAVGDYLPGSAGDSYSMVRLGSSPGATSLTVAGDGTFAGIRVKADDTISASYDFSSEPTLMGVVGQTNGKVVFNPAFIEAHAGKTIWYVQRDFEADSKGIVGTMSQALKAPLFLAPIPSPTDFPFISFGTRTPLTPTLVDTDAALEAAADPAPGTVLVSLATGRLRFSPDDLAKADHKDAAFDKHYLGEQVVYLGVSLSGLPEPTKKAVAVSKVGDLYYIPNAVALPTEFAAADSYRGLGVSGVLDAPDGTGAVPAQAGTQASVRPGGDTLLATTTGRVRRVEDGVGDTFLFSKKRAISTLIVVDRVADLPDDGFKIPKGTAYIAREHDGTGSQVKFSDEDLAEFGSDDIYFLQASLLPAAYTNKARLYSKTRFVFRFEGGENLYFSIDGQKFLWTASEGTFTPDEVAASIETLIGNDGACYAVNGHVVLASNNPTTGTVEIGWGPAGSKDLSGAAALGFLPGWRVKGGVTNWVPDSGVSLGLYRSPLNLDRTRGVADFYATDRIENEVVAESVSATPFVVLDHAPIANIAGFDQDVFFQLRTTVEQAEQATVKEVPLTHFGQVQYRFTDKRLVWLEADQATEKVEKTTATLALGRPGVLPESLLGADGIGGGLYVAADGGAFVLQEQGTEYLLPQEGQSGTALLVEKFGAQVLTGSRGSFTAGSNTFVDPSANFIAASDEVALGANGQPVLDQFGDPVYLPIVREGYRLKVTSGEAAGSYIITDVDPNGTTLTVTPAYLAASSQATTWEVYKGYAEDVYDPGLVADQVYKEFDHLPSETFAVRVLTLLGLVPEDAAAQAASRHKADIEAAVSRGRPLELRVGLTGEVIYLTPLVQEKLGALANYLEAPSIDHAFSIRVGSQSYTPVGVQAFSNNPVGVEYLTVAAGGYAEGTLKFNSQLLADYATSDVWYVETFSTPSDLAGGGAEYDTKTGEINLSAADLAAYAGDKLYLVGRMIAEGRLDVSLAPLTGSIGFQQPVQQGQIVEVEYFQADLEGRKTGAVIVERLSVMVRDETATALPGNLIYEFNPTLQTVDTRFEPAVYVGAMLQNFGSTDYLLEYVGGKGRVTFLKKVTAPVRVTYAVFEAQGGERTYEVSTKPVYRPPFFIAAAKDNFGLRGNRTDDLIAGQLLRLGEHCFYVRSTTYYPASDVTKVVIFPPTTAEVGSRSPANDVLRLVTEGAITTEVDPDGVTSVQTTAPAGFMQTVPTETFPFEPVAKGQSAITFKGDLTQYAAPGHILEVGGRPFTIVKGELNEAGTYTRVALTAPFTTGFSMDAPPTIKLSYRPIYPPGVRDFVGVGQVLDTEAYELVLFGEKGGEDELPGRTLVPSVDYSLDPMTGGVHLLAPVQDALAAGQKLVLAFTRVKTLAPTLKDGAVLYPRYFASYLFNTIPSVDNGLLGAQLVASYTFSSPDTFYFRAVPLSKFLSEAVVEAETEIRSKQPAGGSFKTTMMGLNNWDRGRIGLLGEQRHLYDQDRAARTLLDFYNTTINTFEQVQETISGVFIGDRDGKFRFFVGKGKDWPTPGYEDDISGYLVPRNLWAEVVQVVEPGQDIYVGEDDWIVTPSSLTLSGGEVEGSFPDADALEGFIAAQVPLVHNDVDDRLLIGTKEASVSLTTSFPFFKLRAEGLYRRMGEAHQFSRIFPTVARAFFMTYPGVGAEGEDPGRYTWGTMRGDKKASTYRKDIAQLSNPVLGAIQNVTEGSLHKRRARGRIWGYFPQGLPAGAFVLTGGGASPAITVPCVIATPSALSEFPLHPDTGYPDRGRLLSQGGTVPDADAGDPDLAIPGFEPGDQITWGMPDGKFRDAYFLEQVDVFGTSALTGVFVKEVLHGCVLTFKNADGDAITDSTTLLVGLGPGSGVPAHEFPLKQGGTVLASPSVAVASAPTNDPPTAEDLKSVAAAMDHYRLGFDLAVRTDGRVVDLSLPSRLDPFFIGVKEILGQKSPDPLSPLEGIVQFVYTGQNPLQVPALKGQAKDDSGDYRLPYMRATNTELDRFRQASVLLAEVMTSINGGKYVYPDEVVADDGLLVGSAGGAFGLTVREPATLMSMEDATPATHNPGDLGLGDLRAYDLLLVEVDDTATLIGQGAQGWLTIGAVTSPQVGANPDQYGAFIEPPKFVTATQGPNAPANTTGSPLRYTFENALAYTNDSYPADPQANPPAGVKLIEVDTDGDAVPDTTVLDFSDLGQIALNNGLAAGAGNFNDLWTADPADDRYYNKVTLKLYARTDPSIVNTPGGNALPSAGALLYTIEFGAGQVRTYDWNTHTTTVVAVAANTVQFGVTYTGNLAQILNNKQITIPTPGGGLINFGAGNTNQWFLPYTVTNAGAAGQKKETLYGWEFSISVDTYNWNNPNKGQSLTGFISDDRLTFNEVFDLRMMKARGTKHPLNNATNLEGQLLVHEVTIGSGVSSTVNRDINGGTALTFLARSTGLGSWSSATANTPEVGSIKAMGFEGFSNTPLTASNVRFAALPSSKNGPGGVICSGTGYTESASNSSVSNAWQYENRVVIPAVTQGAISRIEPGDILVIDASDNGALKATNKAGTYLVRHAVQPDGVLAYKALTLSTVAGAETGWAPIHFPRVVGFNDATNALTISDLAPAAEGPTVNGKKTGFNTTFGDNPRIYIVRSVKNLASANQTAYREALISARYTAINAAGDEPVFTLTDYQDSRGNALTAVQFKTLIEQDAPADGFEVSGMAYLPVAIKGNGTDLPTNNVCGYDSSADRSVYGFRWVTIKPPAALSGASNLLFGDAADAGIDGEIHKTGAATRLQVVPGTVEASTGFLDSTDRIVYDGVPTTASIKGLNTAQWNKLNNPPASFGAGAGSVVNCLLPGTTMALANLATSASGFYAQGGIFLEPSFPHSVFDLTALDAHLVDLNHSQLVTDIGMRDADALIGQNEIPWAQPEGVSFEVRRIRRFHEAQQKVADQLLPLRYAYEIRRGTVTAYTATAKQFAYLDAAAGTQLGAFDFADVNIHAGDTVRVLGTDGTVLDEATIISVVSGTRLKLAAPGITKTSPVGKTFQVYLRQAPVPHEQSAAQLLDLLTFKEVHKTTADYNLEKGGYVPEITTTYLAAANKLYDDSLPNGTTFNTLGVKKGDILLIDPAGLLPNDETGARPLGDMGIPARAASWTAGGPNVLDDNRGFYRVTKVEDDHLEVTGKCSFAGDVTTDVVFPSAQAAQVGYAIYPTVSDSDLSGGREGQMDLRPTKKKVGGSYATDAYSLRPFSYRIIRPARFFEDETVDLVLMFRERMLSWIEKIQAAMSGDKAGSYFVFQRDEHALDVGDPTDPLNGLGVLSNLLIESLVGRTAVSPFVNTSDCLSILDRRFWILDRELDSMVPVNNVQSRKVDVADPAFPNQGGPYTAYTSTGVGSKVRPVLPERIDVALDIKDRFRPIRYVWLAYRTHRLLGTLASIERFEAELPQRLDEQHRHMLMLEATEKVE